MAQETTVNTLPTQSAGSLSPIPMVTVLFDVGNLQRCAAFYADILGFRIVRTERQGLPFETNVMVSDRYPGVALFARKTFQRPIAGAVIGGVLQIGFHEPDLARRIAELEGRVTWSLAPGAEQDVTRVSFMDPDGYVVELFR